MNDLQIAKRVASRIIDADDRFRPPKWLVNGVDSGELPPKALLIWKYCVEKMTSKGMTGGRLFGAAVAYWRNACPKKGVDLPSKYQKGSDVKLEYGPWKIKTGDQIEDWVRERLKSEGLVEDVVRGVEEWKLELDHFETEVADAKALIVKHKKGIEEGSRVKQRIEWLAGAEKKLDDAEKGLAKARQAIEELGGTVAKHEETEAPVIEFEKQFQAALMMALKDLDKKDVLMAARNALAKFEEQVEESGRVEEETAMVPAEEPIPPTMRVPYKAAGMSKAAVLGMLWEGVKKLWDIATAAFERITDWAADLMGFNKSLKKMLAQAGAKV